jgi:hypothetical protein
VGLGFPHWPRRHSKRGMASSSLVSASNSPCDFGQIISLGLPLLMCEAKAMAQVNGCHKRGLPVSSAFIFQC